MSRQNRYRIAVTPIENNGLPCPGRCAIEFENIGPQDWMRSLESSQKLHGFNGDERAALVAGIHLLGNLMRAPREPEHDVFAQLRPHFETFVQSLAKRGLNV